MADDGASSGVRICILYEDHTQTSRLNAEEPCTGEATIMGVRTPKKIYISPRKYTIIRYAMSNASWRGG